MSIELIHGHQDGPSLLRDRDELSLGGYYTIHLTQNSQGKVTGWIRTVEVWKRESGFSTLCKIEECLKRHLALGPTIDCIALLNKMATDISTNCLRKKHECPWYLPSSIFRWICLPRINRYKAQVSGISIKIKERIKKTGYEDKALESSKIDLQMRVDAVYEKYSKNIIDTQNLHNFRFRHQPAAFKVFFPPCIGREGDLLNRALQSKSFKAHYEWACINPVIEFHKMINLVGPYEIRFVKNVPIAECLSAKRRIHISSSLSEGEALSYLVFELCNAINCQEFMALDLLAFEGELDCESYVKKIEYIEYMSVLKHRQIIPKIIKELGREDIPDVYGDYPLNFDTHWAGIQTCEHAEHCRVFWNKQFKAQWEKRQQEKSQAKRSVGAQGIDPE